MEITDIVGNEGSKAQGNTGAWDNRLAISVAQKPDGTVCLDVNVPGMDKPVEQHVITPNQSLEKVVNSSSAFVNVTKVQLGNRAQRRKNKSRY